MTVKSPLISRAVSSAQLGHALSFEQRGKFFFALLCHIHSSCQISTFIVPIYDGRVTVNGRPGRPFLFKDDHFKDLASWPLYKKGNHDVPKDSVVAVGYTVGTYVSSNSGAKYLSSNIQFVVVLSVPEAVVG